MTVHAAADTETLGFSAAGVDDGVMKMMWSAGAYERNRGMRT